MSEYDPTRLELGEVVAYLVKAMRSYSNNRALQRVSLVLLAHVSENQENWSSLLKGECIETAVVASKNFINDAEIQHYALEFFSRTATDRDCRESIRTHGGIACVLEVMTNNPAVKHVQQYGALTLNELVREENGAYMMSECNMNVLFADYADYKDDDDVITPVVGVFALFSRVLSLNNGDRLLDRRFQEQLIELLRERRANVKLQSNIYLLIENLAQDGDSKDYFKDEVPELAIESLRDELEKNQRKSMTPAELAVSKEMITHLSEAIRCLVRNIIVKEVVSEDMLELLGQTLRAYDDSNPCVLALLRLYEVLVKEKDYIALIVNQGILTKFFDLYKTCIRSWLIEKSLLKIFRRIANSDAALGENIINKGVIEDASLLIQGYAYRDLLIKQAMLCFQELLDLPIAFSHFINSDVVSYVVQLLPIHVRDREVSGQELATHNLLDQITKTLIKLARPEVGDKFVSSEAVPEVLDVMKKYESEENVQELCMQLLGKLVWIIDGFTDDEARQIVDRVLIARSTFSASDAIAEFSAVVYNYFSQHESHRWKIKQSEVIVLLVGSIQMQVNENTVIHASQALAALTDQEEMVSVFCDNDGIGIALQALDVFSDSRLVCLNVFRMLCVVLADRDKAHIMLVTLSDHVNNITPPFQNLGDDLEVMLAGVNLLALCFADSEWSSVLAEQELPPLVLDVMTRFVDNAEMVTPCLTVLACAAEDSECVENLIEIDVYQKTVDVMEKHKLNRTVSRGVMKLLHHLMDSTEEEDAVVAMKPLERQVVVDMVVDITSAYIDDTELVTHAVNVLADMALNKQVAPYLHNASAFKTIADVIGRYKDNATILSTVLRLLGKEYMDLIDYNCALRMEANFLAVYADLLEVYMEEEETVKAVLELALAMTCYVEACKDAFPHFVPVVLQVASKYDTKQEMIELVAHVLFDVSKNSAMVGQLYDAKVVPFLMQHLGRYEDISEGVVRYLVCALSYIMVDDESNRFQFEDGLSWKDSWQLVFKILRQFYTNGKIGAACAYLASSLTSSDEGVALLDSEKVWDDVYNATRSEGAVEGTFMGSFTFCYLLLKKEIGHKILNHDDCLSMASQGMGRFPESVPLQLKGAKLLREYSLFEETVDLMRKNNAIEALVAALGVKSNEVYTHAFTALRNMCTNCQEVYVLDATSVPTVNDAMCEAQFHKNVLGEICNFLQLGVKEVNVVENVMELIVCLSASKSQAVTLEVRKTIGLMVTYWRNSIDNLQICVLLSSAFALLSNEDRFREEMYKENVLEIVFQQLSMHEWDHKGILAVMRLLAHMTNHSDASRYIVENGLKHLMEVLNKYVENIAVSRTGCTILNALLEHSEYRNALLEAKIIDYYKILMEKYLSDNTILMKTLQMLKQFTSPADIKLLVDGGMVEVVIDILGNQAKRYYYDTIKECTDALIVFTKHPDGRAAILKSSVFKTVFEVLPRCINQLSNEQVADAFSRLLDLLLEVVGEDGKGVLPLLNDKGVSQLVDLLEKFPTPETVTQILQLLLRVVENEQSYESFWEKEVITTLVKCFEEEKYEAPQMEILLEILLTLLKTVQAAKAATVASFLKKTRVVQSLLEVIKRLGSDEQVATNALESLDLLMPVIQSEAEEPEKENPENPENPESAENPENPENPEGAETKVTTTLNVKELSILLGEAAKELSAHHKTSNKIAVSLSTLLSKMLGKLRLMYHKRLHRFYPSDSRGILEGLRDMLDAQYSNKTTIHSITGVITTLCNRKEDASVSAEVGIITVLFKCMKTELEEVFSDCCKTLYRLVSNCKAARSQFVGPNSPRAIYDGLLRYSESEEVVRPACSLLYLLLDVDGKSGRSGRSGKGAEEEEKKPAEPVERVELDVLELSDIPKMCELMDNSWKKKSDGKEWQREVRYKVLNMCLLGFVALGTKPGADEKVMKKLGTDDVTKQVVKTFELKSETHTCLALKVLALSSRTDKGRRSILRADGMEKMLEAFGPFVGSKEHCLNLLEAVYNLLELREPVKTLEKFGLSLIWAAMLNHLEEKPLLEFALRIVHCLRDLPNLSEMVSEEGGMEVLMQAWDVCTDPDEEITSLCVLVTEDVVKNDPQILDPELLESCVGNIKNLLFYTSNPEVRAAAYELLSVLMQLQSVRENLLDEEDGFLQMVKDEIEEKEDPKVIASTVAVLMRLLQENEVKADEEGGDLMKIVATALLRVLDKAKTGAAERASVDEACTTCMQSLNQLVELYPGCDLVESSVHALLCKMMASELCNVTVATNSLKILRSENDTYAKQELGDKNMIDAVVAMMGRFPQSQSIQQSAMEWLAELSTMEAKVMDVNNAATVSAVITAIRACKQQSEAVRTGCEFLVNVMDSQRAVNAMKKQKLGSLLKELRSSDKVEESEAMQKLAEEFPAEEGEGEGKGKHGHHHRHHHSHSGKKHHHRESKKEEEKEEKEEKEKEEKKEEEKKAGDEPKSHHRSKKSHKHHERTEAEGEREHRHKHHKHHHHKSEKDGEGEKKQSHRSKHRSKKEEGEEKKHRSRSHRSEKSHHRSHSKPEKSAEKPKRKAAPALEAISDSDFDM